MRFRLVGRVQPSLRSFFDRTSFAAAKARECSGRKAEFMKRAGFVLMACLAVHNKAMDDDRSFHFCCSSHARRPINETS